MAEADSMSLARKAVLLVSGAPATLVVTTMVPILPKMEAALAHTANEQMLVKMVVAVNGLSMIIGSPLAGVLADKFSRRTLMIWSLVLWAVLGCSGYFIENLHLMVGTRLLAGLAAATALTIGLTMIGDLQDENLRNRYMGLNVSFAVFAAVVTVPLSGLLGDISWRLPFLIFAVSLPLAAVAVYGFKSDDTPTTPAKSSTTAAPVPDRMFIPVVLMILALCCGVASYVVPIYMPFQFRDIGITSSTTIAMSIAAVSITSATMAAFFGAARRFLTSQIAFAFSFTCCCVGIFIAAYGVSLPVILLGLVLAGCGNGWLAPNVMARAAAAATPATRGRVVGLVKGAHMCASFVTVLMLEPISRMRGPKGVLVAVSAMAGAVALICLARHLMLRTAAPQPAPSA